MQVGVEEAEEGELGDLTAAAGVEAALSGGVDDPAAPPVVEDAELTSSEGDPPHGLDELHHTVQVAAYGNEHGAGYSGQVGTRGAGGWGPVSASVSAGREVVDEAKGPRHGQGEDQGNGQVESRGWQDARELGQ